MTIESQQDFANQQDALKIARLNEAEDRLWELGKQIDSGENGLVTLLTYCETLEDHAQFHAGTYSPEVFDAKYLTPYSEEQA